LLRLFCTNNGNEFQNFIPFIFKEDYVIFLFVVYVYAYKLLVVYVYKDVYASGLIQFTSHQIYFSFMSNRLLFLSGPNYHMFPYHDKYALSSPTKTNVLPK